MRWKNLKISHKLNLTFSVFVIIFVLFGAMAILQMKKVQNSAKTISTQELPLSKKITELERNWQQAIFYLRSYGYNKNKQFLYDGLTHLQFTKDNLEVIKKESLLEDQSMINQLNVLANELNSFTTNVKNAQTAIDQQVVTKQKLDSCNEQLHSVSALPFDLKEKIADTQKWIHNNTDDPQIVVQKIEKNIHAFSSLSSDREKNYIKSYLTELNEFDQELNASLNLLNDQMDNGILLTQLLSQMTFEKTQMGINTNIQQATNSIYALIGGLAALLLIGVLGSKYLTASFTKPLYKLVKFANFQAKGQLNNMLEMDQKDEIGQLADSIRTSNNKIKEMVIGLYNTSKKMTEIGHSFNYKAKLLNTHATSQASSSEELSSAMEEMNSLISQNAKDSLLIINTNKNSTVKLTKELNNTEKAMHIMEELIGRSGNIRNIARETSILALNASIEAAKAGSYGKGFGVVAKSIKELAERATDVSNEMSRISSEGKEYSDLAGNSLKSFHEENSQTSTFIQKLSNSAIEQQTESTQMNNAVSDFNNHIQQIALMADELNNDSEHIKNASNEMNGLLSFFEINNGQIIKDSNNNENKKSFNEINTLLNKLNIPGITLSKSVEKGKSNRKKEKKKKEKLYS